MSYDPAVTTYFVDVTYETRLDLSHTRLPQESLSLSSDVYLPSGFVPHIRNVSTCQYP